MKALLICFSYSELEEFRFNKRHCDADLLRIWSYLKQTGCEEIEVLTDYISIIPSTKVSGREEVLNRLKRFLSQDLEGKKMVYISGHALREKTRKRVKMLLPNSKQIQATKIQEMFSKVTEGTGETTILLDICHSESFMIRRPALTFVGATRIGQTCGFHKDEDMSGSLFSYYLIHELRKGERDLDQIMKIDRKVNKIRRRFQKQDQNVVVYSTRKKLKLF